jgi:serine phosphatase RsbU (regulator of sigma subunit)
MTGLRLRVETREGVVCERELEGDQIVVGRAASADIMLADALVSRQHVRFYRAGDDWWVEDLGARNRTLLNERALATPSALHSGDVLRVGQTVLRVVSDAETIPANGSSPASPHAEPVFEKTTSGLSDEIPLSSSDNLAGYSARLHMLNDVHRALATTVSLPELLDLILERCFAVLRPEQGIILLQGPDGEMRRAASRTRPGESDDILVSRRIVEEVAGKGQSALVIDATRDERFAASDSIIESGVRSVVAVPLIDAEGVIGMIALYSRINVRRFSQQDMELLMSLASAATLRVRNVALGEEVAARRVLEHELALAHDIQMAMLPREMPRRPEVDVAARLKPARSVGGDLYDVVLAEERIWFIIGDVSGKGVAAALYMAVAKTLFRAIVPSSRSLEGLVSRMNEELARDNERFMFVTAIAGWIDLATGGVALSDAGHNLPLVLRKDGTLEYPSIRKTIALGVVDAPTYDASLLQMLPGDTLLLYTDGITDARSVSGEQFDIVRLERALAARKGSTAADLVGGIVTAVEHFAAGAPPEDDLAVLAIRFLGPAGRIDEM